MIEGTLMISRKSKNKKCDIYRRKTPGNSYVSFHIYGEVIKTGEKFHSQTTCFQKANNILKTYLKSVG